MGTNIQVSNKIWIDYLRVISTLAVIIIHVSAVGVISLDIESKDWFIANFYDSISRFCVPVFFMISGALLLNKDYELKEFLKKRAKRILLPLLFWSILYFIINNKQFLFYNFKLTPFFNKIIRALLYGSNYHLHFVYILIGLYLCIPILRIWIKNSPYSYLKYFLLIWIVAALYRVPGLVIYLPKIDLSNFSGYLGYMILGWFLFSFSFKSKYLYIILFVIFTSVTVLGTYYVSIYSGDFYEYFYDYLSINVILASSCIFLFFKNNKFNNDVLNSIVVLISKYSFGVYLVHDLVLYSLIKFNIDMFTMTSVLSIPLVSVLCLSISLGIIFLINKIPYGKYISG